MITGLIFGPAASLGRLACATCTTGVSWKEKCQYKLAMKLVVACLLFVLYVTSYFFYLADTVRCTACFAALQSRATRRHARPPGWSLTGVWLYHVWSLLMRGRRQRRPCWRARSARGRSRSGESGWRKGCGGGCPPRRPRPRAAESSLGRSETGRYKWDTIDYVMQACVFSVGPTTGGNTSAEILSIAATENVDSRRAFKKFLCKN